MSKAKVDYDSLPNTPGERLRWMGDAYQQRHKDSATGVVKLLALVQTPHFVGDLLLDQTLEKALEEFPLEDFRTIDPTCGTGHLLCQMFDRLWAHWESHAPEMPKIVRARNVLRSIHGVDMDPLCVAIAKFRLIAAACDVCRLLPYDGEVWRFYPQVLWADSLLPSDHELQPFVSRNSMLLEMYGEYTTPEMMDRARQAEMEITEIAVVWESPRHHPVFWRLWIEVSQAEKTVDAAWNEWKEFCQQAGEKSSNNALDWLREAGRVGDGTIDEHYKDTPFRAAHWKQVAAESQKEFSFN